MNLQQLEYFKIAAEKENYTTAAKMLGVSQSNLSHAITKLEKELNITLFEKHGRSIRLSQNGKEFYRYVKSALDTLDKGRAKMSALSQSEDYKIRIGHIHNAARDFAAQAIFQFRKDSGIPATFELKQDASITLLEAMQEQKLDLALASMVASEDTGNRFEFVPVYREEMVVIVPKNHHLKAAGCISVRELSGENFIAYHRKSGLHNLILDALKESGTTVQIAADEITDLSICRLVSMGKGVSIVPNTPDLLDYDVVILKLKENLFNRLIYLCWCADLPLPEHVFAFIKFIIKHYALPDDKG
ncbi:MAG: LysR family transcriptional regulator [Lachnospiraceae bacterium]